MYEQRLVKVKGFWEDISEEGGFVQSSIGRHIFQ